MAQMHTPDALTYLAGRPLTPAAGFALRLVVAFVKWEDRRRTRVHLKHLDDHLLDDIGLTRAEAHKEFRRPFWEG